MGLTSRDSIFEQAKEWVYEAGENIRSNMYNQLTIETKSNANDLVTELDKKIEKFFAEKIRGLYSNHRIIGEEGYGDDVHSLEGTIWIIDPIDGTMNFVHQKRNFAISVGIYHDGIGQIGIIYDVMDDVLYTAVKGEGAYKNNQKLPQLNKDVVLEKSIIAMNSYIGFNDQRINTDKIKELIAVSRGTRSYGSAALEFAFVAEGIIDAYVSLSLAPWDIAAGMILVEEVGGITTTAQGDKVNLLEKSPILTCNQEIFTTLTKDYIEIK
ncbi:myo-inositol-1(or 4)-monophosphatase [Gracilibacillus halotolerans]|uniref:inositol-phosphate phosphatase n=1 Tax=Gracilibacillus halotolerans TaxID=74386 RepID=A0A841RK16_9BACI|nr:inositol monophosphatase family protein [Gracilibacillus halotolerans]MBB6511314.1 myo-inositol-1(or 4)-monophosphatase [Gracilibacillus halotolerans]